MLNPVLGYVVGVILLYFSGDLINSGKYSLNFYIYLQIAFSGICVLLLLYAYFAKAPRLFKIMIIFLCFVLGYGYAYFKSDSLISARISPIYDQKNVQISAFLCSLPKQGQYSFSADFCVLEINSIHGLALPGKGFKARLRWPLEYDFTNGVNTFYVKSRQPRSSANFIGAPFEASLKYQQIFLMGSIKNTISTSSKVSLGLKNRLIYEYHQIRLNVSRYASKLLADTHHKGLIRALLLGDRSQISAQAHKVLANTGTQHLIAISGLHVGLVILGIYWLLPKSIYSIIFVSTVGLLYVLLVGFTPSAQRAWVMCVCVLIYLSGYIKQSQWKPFVISMCLILILDPLATLNLGFWYSFLCVAIIFMVLQFTLLDLNRGSSLLILQFILMFAMIPISSLLGTRHGLENSLANMLAIPWVSLWVLPFTLLSFTVSFVLPAFSAYLMAFLDASIEVLIAYLMSLSLFRFPLAIDAGVVTIIGFVAVFLAFLIFNKIKMFMLASVLVLILAITLPSRLYQHSSELMVFDVGQGLALALKSKGGIWLYDTGPAFKKSSSTRNVILPYLRQHQKSNTVEGVIISHGDADHAGDLLSLFEEFHSERTFSGQPSRIEVPGFERCEAGMRWAQGDFNIEVLYPFQQHSSSDPGFSEPGFSGLSSNNQSCVVKVSLFGKIFLLMGDLESDAELSLVKHYRDKLKADVLIAGHHGAPKGTSFALLKHVQPDYVVFSAGYLNKFGHPSQSVLQRVAPFNSTVLNTAKNGALSFQVSQDASEFTIKTRRDGLLNPIH